jgi:hypothetical protein
MADRIVPLPESTEEVVHNVQFELSQLAILGDLRLFEEEGMQIYVPTYPGTLIVTRSDILRNDTIAEYPGIVEIAYPAYPGKNSLLHVTYTNSESVVSNLTTRGITKLEFKKYESSNGIQI